MSIHIYFKPSFGSVDRRDLADELLDLLEDFREGPLIDEVERMV